MIVSKPENPLDFLIEKLQNPAPVRRVVIIGPPGCSKKANGNVLSAQMNWTAIDSGSLIKKEINRKTPSGLKIKDQF